MSDIVEDGQIVTLLSVERLAPFLSIAGTEKDAIELHNQALRLSGALMPLMALTEIVLRNAICERLRSNLGVPNWLISPPPSRLIWRKKEEDCIRVAVAHAQKAAYAKLPNSGKKALDRRAFPSGVPQGIGHAKRAKQRQSKIQVGIGQTIAQLTLHFWKRLFSADYETSLWKPALRSLFPNKAISRVDVARHLEIIYQARNRIAHHESLIGDRLEGLMASIDFIAVHLGTKAPTEEAILLKLLLPFRQVLDKEIAATDSLVKQFSLNSLPESA